MKTLISSLLVGTLALLSPEPAAQHVVASVYSSGHGYGGYASSRVWIPARYETVYERVWVPGRSERIWVDPVYQLRFGACGSRFRVLLSAGHWKTIHHPGHYATRRVRVLQPGHWARRGSCD